MRPISKTLTLLTPTADNICLSQTPGAAGNLTLNGALVTGGVASLGDTAHLASITSAGNCSTVIFTFTGTSEQGAAQTEVVTGPNATTVYSTKYWKTVTQIAISAAAPAALTVGSGNGAITNWIPLDVYRSESDVGLGVTISGTINYTVQHTMEPLLRSGVTPSWLAHSVLAAQTASASSSYTHPVHATRLKVNSFTSGATAVFNVV